MIADYKEIEGEGTEGAPKEKPEGGDGKPEGAKSRGLVAKALLDGTVALGKGAAALFRKMCGIRDPKAALAEVEAQLEAVRAPREKLAARYDGLYSAIVAKKKLRESTSPARRRMLDLELQTLLAEYKSIERELTALYRKEAVCATVRGRMEELVVQNLPMPKAADVDRLADDIEKAVETDDDLVDAVRDLQTAGASRERAVVDLDEALSAFDEEAGETAPGKEEVREN